jgi:hypothetical protein
MPDPCYCGSLRDAGLCHGALAAEKVEIRVPEELKLRIPATLPREEARKLAGSASTVGSYDIRLDDSDGSWVLRPRGGGPYLELVPLARGDYNVQPEHARPNRIKVGPLLPETIPPTSPAARAVGLIAIGTSPKPRTVEEIHTFKDRVAHLLVVRTAEEVLEVSRSVVDVLRAHLPYVGIDLLAIDQRLLSDCVMIRLLARLQILTVDEITAQHAFPGPEGAINLVLDPERHFQLLSSLGYPDAHGFSNPYLSCRAYIDYGEDVFIQPADWAERRARDIGASIMSHTSGSTKIRGLNSDFASRRFLRVWLTRMLNRLFAQLLHLGTFRERDQQFIDPIRQWQDLLTVQDILDLTGTLFTTSDPVVMKLLFFDLMDRYVALGGGSVEDLLQRRFIEKACAGMGDELADLRDPIRRFVQRAWDDTEEGLWEGIYDERTRQDGKIVIKDGKGGSEELDRAGFARRMLGVLRNTTHGYDLKREEFERFLVHHNGVMPDRVRELALGFWFSLLSDPSLFWKARARFDLMKWS